MTQRKKTVDNEIEKLVRYSMIPVGRGREWVQELTMRRKLRALVRRAESMGRCLVDCQDWDDYADEFKCLFGFRP